VFATLLAWTSAPSTASTAPSPSTRSAPPRRGGEDLLKQKYGKDIQLYIDPDECISCGACEPECPVEAIFEDEETPEKWKHFIELNATFFQNR